VIGKLFLVPTPIGNLEDMTFRAIRILKEADIILAEDTRTSAPMLKHFGIDKKAYSHHQHNEHQATSEIIKFLKEGKNVALISDAGTPAISDPGFFLVREAIKNELEVECLPGATAFVPALVNSGLPSDSFVFEGFLPVKKGRQTRFKKLADEDRTIVLYESPHRLLKTLEEFGQYLGTDRQASVSRELIKSHFENNILKGEFVICIAGCEPKKASKKNFD
jgi:16S rRNA (cytidine1402-2'-O)-methyltransferase